MKAEDIISKIESMNNSERLRTLNRLSEEYFGGKRPVEEKEILNRYMLIKMINELPLEKLPKAWDVFEQLIPQEDEELTDYEIEAIEEGRKQLKRGETVSLKDLIRELDI